MPQGHPIKWTEEMDELVIRASNCEFTYNDLAERWKVAASTISDRANKLGTSKEYWTAEQVEILRREWANDLSCRDISKLVLKSRNAVIGKARRLGLARKFTMPPRPEKPEEAKPKKKHVRKKKVAPPTPIVEHGPLGNKEPIGLMELRAHTCRAPVGYDEEGRVTYCGHFNFPGKPFCPEHCRMFYTREVA